MAELTDFQRDTAAAPLGEGRYLVNLNDRWWIGPGPNGGYVAALMLEAMTQASAPGQPARSLTVHFLRRPVIGEAEVHVTVERAGRSTTFISSRMLQEGKIQAQAIAVFSASRQDEPTFDFSHMPEAIPPEDGVELDTTKAPIAVFGQYRAILLNGVPYSHGQEAVTSGWVRLRDDQPMTPVLAAAMLDVWFPAPYVALDSPALAPTLEYTVHFPSALPAPGYEEPDWSLIQLRADQACDGHFSEDGTLWTRDGRLLARSRQIALLREPRQK